MGSDLPQKGDHTMKVNERLTAVRTEARELFPALDGATKVGTDTYIVAVENGFAKVTISAVKDVEFNPEEARLAYEAELEVSRAKAEARATKKAEAEAAKAAKKAAKEKAE